MSPGTLGFETAPFKLTQVARVMCVLWCMTSGHSQQEMVDVMGGVSSEVFHYFQVMFEFRNCVCCFRHTVS
jgi:hypothetical protein